MTEKYSRAQRRADYARIKAKRQFHWGYGHKTTWAGRDGTGRGNISYMAPQQAGLVARTSTPCSCWMCCNPRHAGFSRMEALTRQELKADDIFKEQYEDWEDWRNAYYEQELFYAEEELYHEEYRIYCNELRNWRWAKARGWIT